MIITKKIKHLKLKKKNQKVSTEINSVIQVTLKSLWSPGSDKFLSYHLDYKYLVIWNQIFCHFHNMVSNNTLIKICQREDTRAIHKKAIVMTS